MKMACETGMICFGHSSSDANVEYHILLGAERENTLTLPSRVFIGWFVDYSYLALA